MERQKVRSLENFSTLTHNVSTQLDVFMKAIHDIEFPNSVEATNKLLENQTTAYECLKVDIFEATKHGEELLFHIKSMEEFKDFFERIGNISAIERLLVQLEETDLQFDEFWRKHQDLLGQCLHLRIFEQDFRKMQSVLDGHIKTITEFTENGESVERVATLIQETEAFFIAVDVDLKMGEDVMLAGQHLIRSQAVCPWEAVQPKCDELKRVCDLIRLRLDNRLSSLAKNKELMERIEKANLWCTNGVDLLASQRLEKCSVSMELAELEAFISTASDFKLTSPSELKRIFLEGTTPETKALVAQVLQRIDDVSLMCDKRIASLKKLSLKPTRPVLQVSPEPAVPLQPPRGAPYLLYPDPNKANDKQDWRTRRSNGIPSLEITDQQNQQDTETRCLKRGHVLKELLETERIYVNEMGSILKGYSDRLKSEVQAPASLQGKEDILFGNLKELYRFHCEVFLKDLENCISATELVALCFVQRRDTFYQLYSFYCQNIPRSERLRETLVDTHIFLQECQKRLGHKLPLAAYLLKPVQRITKYQLLLKDLLRFSDSGSCSKELQKALDCMLIVLKCVNDSMHQVAITGFPGDVAQQGELLMQDSFQVWTESKKDIRLRIKPQQRHIFLYQKSMLFCKETLKPGHNKSTYQFKNHVKMSQIGLTESVRGDTKRFEVWLQGRQEVHTLQAPSVDIKQKWVAEIKRVLFNQLEELKGEKIKQYGINQQDFRQTTFWDSPSNTVTPTNHTIYVETLPEASNLKSKCSSDFFSTVTELSDKDQQQNCSFSLECSNSEEELAFLEESSSPGDTFVVLADYSAMTHSEVAMREGDTVELLKVGCAGWWYVRTLDTNAEGWAPAAYMEHLNRKSERVLSRHKERINFKQPN